MNTTRCAHIWTLYGKKFKGDKSKTRDLRRFFRTYMPEYLKIHGNLEY
ncbi:MAG: hypothetical protein GTN93_00665 [Anaerolineae bacterium]|nr:hypothetical protein [Anaerolineae bacterium]